MNGEKDYERIRFDEIDSTNEYAKSRRGERRNLIVTAKRQTGGLGTKGRSFSSEEGGVYLTRLTFYEGFPVGDAFKIMSETAVAVCETLRAYGLHPVVKWPNDVYVRDKKICGILIENVFSGREIFSSTVGIGLNVYNGLPVELAENATTMWRETGKRYDVEEVTERLIAELGKRRSGEEYLSYIGYMGRQATLIIGNESVPVTLLSVDSAGGLHVRTKDGEVRYTAAEVSLRL